MAGLLTTGIPARSATAAFSASPQAGKLKALMWRATPCRGTAMCWPWKRGERAERDALPVHQESPIAQRPPEVCVRGQGEDRAVHVELGVAACVAARDHGEVQELVTSRLERVAHRLHQLAALREGQGPQGGPAPLAGVEEGGAAIDAARGRARERLLGRGVHEGGEAARSFDPAAADVRSDRLHRTMARGACCAPPALTA